MRFLPATLGFALATAMLAEVALAIIYVPGRYENGVYIRPHFTTSEAARPRALEALMDGFGEPPPAERKLPPGASEPQPPAHAPGAAHLDPQPRV